MPPGILPGATKGSSFLQPSQQVIFLTTQFFLLFHPGVGSIGISHLVPSPDITAAQTAARSHPDYDSGAADEVEFTAGVEICGERELTRTAVVGTPRFGFVRRLPSSAHVHAWCFSEKRWSRQHAPVQ